MDRIAAIETAIRFYVDQFPSVQVPAADRQYHPSALSYWHIRVSPVVELFVALSPSARAVPLRYILSAALTSRLTATAPMVMTVKFIPAAIAGAVMVAAPLT